MSNIKKVAPENEIREAEEINKIHLPKVHEELSLMGAVCVFSMGLSKHGLPVVCFSEQLSKEKIIEFVEKALYDIKKQL